VAKCGIDRDQRHYLWKLEWQALQISEGVAFEDWCLSLKIERWR